MKHVSGRPLPAKDANPEVPEELDAMVGRLLARDPEDRYRDADELVEDLERVQRGESLAMADTHRMERRPPGPPVGPPEASWDDNRRGWRWVPVSVALLLLALLGGTAYAFGPWGTAPEAVVPHLVGADSIEEAREMVGDRFEVVKGGSVEGTRAVGTIAAQDPYAGELVEVGSEISLDVVGTRIADVPDVRQKTREEAGRILKKAGFEIEVKTTRSSAEDENLVIEQKPSGNADEPAKVDSAVAITVGQGPGSVAVPGVDGQALSAVGQILMEAGLKLGSQMEVPNDRVPEGHVVEQHPAAGTEVEPGSNVDVVVGSGPQQPPTPIAEDGEQPIASKASASAAPSSTTPASSAPALADDGERGFEHETPPASTAPASPAPAAPVPALAADAERGFEHEDGLENEFERDDSSGPGGGNGGSSGSGSSGHGGPGRH
jgi:serine/threonine-protein kinase